MQDQPIKGNNMIKTGELEIDLLVVYGIGGRDVLMATFTHTRKPTTIHTTNNTHVRLLKMLDHVKNDISDKLGEKQQEGR